MIDFNLIYANPDDESSMGNYFDFNFSQALRRVLDEVAKVLKIDDYHVVSYIIVNNEQIHHINLDYRKIDRPTDVISFACVDDYKDENGQITFIPYELGDIYLSYEKVIAQAKEYQHSNLREFSFLVTHGILHLLGYDHMQKDDEKVMFDLQNQILNNLKIYR